MVRVNNSQENIVEIEKKYQISSVSPSIENGNLNIQLQQVIDEDRRMLIHSYLFIYRILLKILWINVLNKLGLLDGKFTAFMRVVWNCISFGVIKRKFGNSHKKTCTCFT